MEENESKENVLCVVEFLYVKEKKRLEMMNWVKKWRLQTFYPKAYVFYMNMNLSNLHENMDKDVNTLITYSLRLWL